MPQNVADVAAYLHTSSCSHYVRDGKPLAPVPSLAPTDISGRTSDFSTHLQVKYTFRAFLKHKYLLNNENSKFREFESLKLKFMTQRTLRVHCNFKNNTQRRRVW